MGYKKNHHQYDLFSELDTGEKIYRVYMNDPDASRKRARADKLPHVHVQIERWGSSALVDFGKVTSRHGITKPHLECHISGAKGKSDSEVIDEAIMQILSGSFA
jgi:hypothetical protein